MRLTSIFATTGVTALFLSIAALAQHDTQFRGDAAHTGLSASAAPASIAHVLWKFQTGGNIYSSPVVSDGVVYVGSNDRYLHAIDAHRGTETWKFKTGANVNSTAAVSNGVVYFLSCDGNAYALDAHTGALIWKFETEGESRLSSSSLYGLMPSREVKPDLWDFYLSSPTVVGGIVYFGSGDRNVYALNAQTGKLVWKHRAGDVVHSSPAIVNGVLYIGCWDGVLYALNAQTGELKWNFATGTDPAHSMQGIPGSPAISEGIVVFGSRDSNLYALDAGTGKLLWQQGNQSSWVIASPAIANGVVYFTTSDSLEFRALDLKTGKPIFDLPYKAYSFSSPTIAAGHAYFGSFDGIVHDIDLASRQIHSEFRVQASIDHQELLTADGHLDNAAIFAPLDSEGRPNNTLDAAAVVMDRLLKLGSILATPSVAGGIVYAASADGGVYALK